VKDSRTTFNVNWSREQVEARRGCKSISSLEAGSDWRMRVSKNGRKATRNEPPEMCERKTWPGAGQNALSHATLRFVCLCVNWENGDPPPPSSIRACEV